MARMWPRQIPPDVLQNPLRSTEINVYNHLRFELDDSWDVFYSRPWLGLTSTGAEKDGECDFIVAHPVHGVLCLEVKGGAVAWNPETDQWTSRDRHAINHRIKDPVAQARSSKHELLKRLKTSPAIGGRWICMAHGVVLPDSVTPDRDLGPDRPLRLFCFDNAFERQFGEWILGRLRDAAGDAGGAVGPGKAGINTLRTILARPFALNLSLGTAIREEQREQDALTQQQFHLLEAIREQPRVLIHGGAGTGKTVLAMHLAETLGRGGTRTLLICYNRLLARRMADTLSAIPNLLVRSFHQLCTELIGDAGRPLPEMSGDYFDVALPTAAEAVVSGNAACRFDAVIVDEGQDFTDVWWLVVDALLTPGSSSVLRVFADNNQRLHAGADRLRKDLQLSPIALSWNLRNTPPIHEAAYRHYSGRPIRCAGPSGQPLVAIEVEDGARAVSRTVELVKNLMVTEGLAASEIAVIVSDAETRAALQARFREATGGAPIVETVRRFKGMEAPVAVVIVDAAISSSDEFAYVALSRARTRAYLIGQRRHLSVLGC